MSNNDNILTDYKQCIEDNFDFFRMFLPEDIDALLVHFIYYGTISVPDLEKLDRGFNHALMRLIKNYPSKVAKSRDEKIKAYKKDASYETENYNHQIVFRMSQIILHLISTTNRLLEINK